MKLVKDTIRYTLPVYSSLSKFDLAIRNDTVDRANQHGGIVTGDGKVDTRTVEVEIMILDTNTAEEYRRIANEIKRYAYRKDQQLWISKFEYINVAALNKLSESFFKGYYRVRGTLVLSFVCTDPFVYEIEAVTETKAITASPTTWTVNNPGNVDVPVVLTITPTAANASMSLVNTSDNNRTFGYTDTGFTAGKVLVADGLDGTVERDGANTINAMGGTFLNLLPGANVLTYTGAACTLQMVFARRWL